MPSNSRLVITENAVLFAFRRDAPILHEYERGVESHAIFSLKPPVRVLRFPGEKVREVES